jgi:hypothetical protein
VTRAESPRGRHDIRRTTPVVSTKAVRNAPKTVMAGAQRNLR